MEEVDCRHARAGRVREPTGCCEERWEPAGGHEGLKCLIWAGKFLIALATVGQDQVGWQQASIDDAEKLVALAFCLVTVFKNLDVVSGTALPPLSVEGGTSLFPKQYVTRWSAEHASRTADVASRFERRPGWSAQVKWPEVEAIATTRCAVGAQSWRWLCPSFQEL